VFIDADGSHDPDTIPALVDPILRDEADLVIGSRMRGGSDELFSSFRELIRLFGSEIITIAINYRFNVRLTDYQNGFRAIRRDTMLAIDTRERTFTIEQEMAIKALKGKYRLIEVPAHEFRRMSGKSHIVVWRAGPRYVWCLIKNLM
jgi:dolichol-phosphate mannosyltransferase